MHVCIRIKSTAKRGNIRPKGCIRKMGATFRMLKLKG